MASAWVRTVLAAMKHHLALEGMPSGTHLGLLRAEDVQAVMLPEGAKPLVASSRYGSRHKPGVCGPAGHHRPAAGIGWPRLAELAAARAPGREPYDDEDGHRDQPDDDERLERSHDPGRSRDGKPYGENRAENCPDDPAHVPSMPPDLGRR